MTGPESCSLSLSLWLLKSLSIPIFEAVLVPGGICMIAVSTDLSTNRVAGGGCRYSCGAYLHPASQCSPPTLPHVRTGPMPRAQPKALHVPLCVYADTRERYESTSRFLGTLQTGVFDCYTPLESAAATVHRQEIGKLCWPSLAILPRNTPYPPTRTKLGGMLTGHPHATLHLRVILNTVCVSGICQDINTPLIRSNAHSSVFAVPCDSSSPTLSRRNRFARTLLLLETTAARERNLHALCRAGLCTRIGHANADPTPTDCLGSSPIRL